MSISKSKFDLGAAAWAAGAGWNWFSLDVVRGILVGAWIRDDAAGGGGNRPRPPPPRAVLGFGFGALAVPSLFFC